MPVIGGDFTEITFNHNTEGSGSLNPKAGEDSTLDPGGFRNDDDQGSRTGNGQHIFKKNNMSPMAEMVCAVDMNERNEVEGVLTRLAASNEEANWTFSHINGTVWAMTGQPVGDLQWNANASTFTLKILGSGTLKKITG